MAQTVSDKHTRYAFHASQLNEAKDTIRRTRRYFFPADQLPPEGEDGDWNKWLVTVTVEQCSLYATVNKLKSDPAADPAKLTTMETAMNKYVVDYNAAVAAYPQQMAEMQTLESTNDKFLAPESKLNEYLHVLDEETCSYLCAGTSNSPTQQSPSAPCPCQFFGEKTIELTGSQTDAVRVWNSNSHLKSLTVIDNRTYTEAHRDAIQLIPPKMTDKTRKIKMLKDGFEQEQDWILCDQMSAAILENVTVEACTVKAPGGPLQGIFSSDGLFSNLKILNNTIQTAGEHAITINGFLSGEISGNTLQAVAGKTPAIRLYPTRIGGNQAEEGVAWVLSFANEGGSNPVLQYSQPILGNNPLVGVAGKTQAELIDARSDMPENYRWNSFGLENFRYYAFRDEFSTLTFGQYRTLDGGKYYIQLKAWLEDRIAEYTNGIRKMKGYLPDITNILKDERHTQVLPTLQKALTNAVNSSTYDHVSISNFPETPIKVFVAKQIALRHGTLKKLVALNGMVRNDLPNLTAQDMENRRQATLKYLLDATQLANTTPNPLSDPTLQSGTQGETGGTGSTATPTAPEPVKATGAYGTGLKDDLMAAATSVAQGEEITFFFKEGSPYNSGYTFFWRVANIDSSVVAFGSSPRYSMNTSKLDVKADHRIQVVLRQGDVTLSGGALFGVAAKATTVSPEPSTPTPAETAPTTLTKNYGALKILAQPLTVQQGDSITFSADASTHSNAGDKLAWFWSANGKTASTATLTLDTTGVAVGEYNVKATLYVTPAGTTQRTAIAGSAMFTVTVKAAAPEPQASPAPVLPKPLTASGDLKAYIRVSETSVPQGNSITFSIDPNYLAEQQQGAKLTYYWTAPTNSGNPAGQVATYTIKTDTLVPGNNHVVKVTLYKQLDGSTTRTSIGGVATFGVTAAAPTTGTINVVVMDIDTQQPIAGEQYTLILDADPAKKSYPGTTEADGSILVKNIPLGSYTLIFTNPAFLSAEIVL
ncbi:MAG: hypothetical protein QJT81_02620 [Candidatus Thiothrix putei]|uniref:Uncharacterized protein n=1 Tax=Candidatus Thiothrix putei TaxID=3080811 RepID=A0AA95HHJ6_9GAMM|nr:MAG: hypothetical protein QJT81_02620 [Candidatus Thiothrix putei]